jgi:hypothetical protein
MKIGDYISEHQMQRADTPSLVKPWVVPSSLAAKFTNDDDVEYYVDSAKTHWVGICLRRNFFAAWKPEAITTGELEKPYPTLRSF